MRTVLVQAAIGEQHSEMLLLTHIRHAMYAAKLDMDYIAKIYMDERQADECLEGRNRSWIKVALIWDLLTRFNYDYVIWLDADCLIVDKTKDLREALPETHQLGFTFIEEYDPPRFNCGAWWIRKCDWTLEFLGEIWDRSRDHNYPEWDEGAVNEVWREGQFQHIFKVEDKWNSSLAHNPVENPAVKAWHGHRDARLDYMKGEISLLTQRQL